MKTSYLIALLLILSTPLAARAAYNDVSFDSTTISLSTGTYTINGVVATTTINASSFDLTLSSGSVVTIYSTGKHKFSVSDVGTLAGVVFDCLPTESKLKLTGSASSGATVTVTPNATTCDSSQGGGGSSPPPPPPASGGGSSSTSSTASAATTTTTTTTTTTPAPAPAPALAPAPAPAPAAPLGFIFTASFGKGDSGPQVLALQKILNTDTATKIAASGPGSTGNETTLFGALTEAAVKKFQVKYGISPANGFVGSKTIAKLNVLSLTSPVSVAAPTSAPASAPVPVSPATGDTQAKLDAANAQLQELLKQAAEVGVSTPTAVGGYTFTTGFGKGSSGEQVMKLQQILNSDSETQIAVSGAGSPGNETTLFGSLTEAAVKKFQVKYGIAGSGDAGYGYVGPKTRAQLNALSTGTVVPAPSPAPSSSPAASNSTQAKLDAANAQLQELLKQAADLNAPAPAPVPAPAPATTPSSTDAIQAQLNAAMKQLNELLKQAQEIQ